MRPPSRLLHLFHRAPKVPTSTPESFGFYAIYIASFLFTFSYALPVYLASPFIEQYVPKSIVGLVFTASAVLSLLLLVKIPMFLRRFGNRRVAVVFMFIELLSLLGLAIFNSPPFIISFFIVQQGMVSIIAFNLDLFLESFSRDSDTGTIRGAYLTLTGLALLAGPLIAGLLLIGLDYWRVFLVGAIVLIFPIFLIFFSLRTFKDPLYVDISYGSALKHLEKNNNIRNILLARLLLGTALIWIAIYLPIYLYNDVGFSLTQILSILFPIALLPYVFIQFPLGRRADQRHDEKELLFVGFFIAAIATILISFITSSNIFVWAGILILGRIGIAIVQIMCSTYFYKQVDASNSNLISLFRAIQPMSIIIAPIIATFFLVVFGVSYQYLFIIIGITLFLGIPLSYMLERTE